MSGLIRNIGSFKNCIWLNGNIKTEVNSPSSHNCMQQHRMRSYNSLFRMAETPGTNPSIFWQLRQCRAFASCNYIVASSFIHSILRGKKKGSTAWIWVLRFSCWWKSSWTGSVRCLWFWLSQSLTVLALDPHPVHSELFASVHLQPSVHKVLHLLQPCLSEHVMELIWNEMRRNFSFSTS